MQHIEVENFCNLIDRQMVDCNSCPALARMGVVEIGLTHATEGWHFQRINSDHAFLSITLGGRGEVAVDGRWQETVPEMAYLMPSRIFHGYRVAPGAEWHYVWVRFIDPGRYPNLFAPAEARLMEVESYSIFAAVEGFIKEFNHANNPHLLGLWAELLYNSLLQLTFSLKLDSRLEQLWAIVGLKLDRHWSLDALADIAHMSREQLRRLCWQYYGCTPHKKLTSLRLHRACEMLLLEDTKLEVISKKLAYSDAFAFSRAFKREFGVSPKAYRELACRTRLKSRTDLI